MIVVVVVVVIEVVHLAIEFSRLGLVENAQTSLFSHPAFDAFSIR